MFGSFNAVHQWTLPRGRSLAWSNLDQDCATTSRQPRREQHVPGQRAHSATDNGPGWRDRCNKPIYADVFPRTWPAIVFSQNNTFFPTNQMQRAIYKILDQSIIVIKKRCNVLNCKKNCGRY